MQKARSEELQASADMAVRANSAPSEQDIPVPAGPLRVLVAEDNLVNQKVLQKVLQRVTPDSPIFIAQQWPGSPKGRLQHCVHFPLGAVHTCG